MWFTGGSLADTSPGHALLLNNHAVVLKNFKVKMGDAGGRLLLN